MNIKLTSIWLEIAICLSLCNPHLLQAQNITNYDVVWDSPSNDAHGSMPLGNGDISLNAWVEPNGDLQFYIGKTDSWGEHGRLLKVGKLRVTLDPPLSTDSFVQRLVLIDGVMTVQGGTKNDTVKMKVWVDANHPVIHVEIGSTIPRSAVATIEPWRTERISIAEVTTSDTYEDRSRPNKLREEVFVDPDVVIDSLENNIAWYHYSQEKSHAEELITIQGLDAAYENAPDPLLNRVFGAIVTTNNGSRLNAHALQTQKSKSIQFDIHVLTEHPTTPDAWLTSINEQIDAFNETRDSWQAHQAWWNEFWNRSWIEVSNSEDAYLVSSTYTLQRYIDACAGRGAYPIKFNGSIFTVPHEGKWGDADYRRWGPGYWWQNTRLPYLSMNASGDFDLQETLFKMYIDDLFNINLHRTKQYTGHDGLFMPECIYFWGASFAATYEWEPYANRGEDKLQRSPWHKWEWVNSLELSWMMFEFYEHTQDEQFLQERLIPYATEVLRFFDEQYETDDVGKLVMEPSMALETWWDTTNPLPEIAGLHAVSAKLLALPEEVTTAENRKYWASVAAKIPPIPTHRVDGVEMLAPAARFKNKMNVENPELYAVFPFQLVTFDSPDVELGKAALEHRTDKGAFGWRQDDLFMTHLGLAEQAKNNLVARAKNKHTASRFPAFWGPNYDWVPDQDHGGVLMRTLQTMLMQTDGKKIHLLPAWPKDWEADFKLHAPYNTTVAGRVRNGQIEYLKVSPRERRDDIVIH